MILQVMKVKLSLRVKHGVVRVKEILSERDNSDYELVPSLAKKRCSTPSGQSASFSFNS